MMHAPVHRAEALAHSAVTAVACCLRAARDGGVPVQQRLHAMLSPHDCGMLAPVFDSLITLREGSAQPETQPSREKPFPLLKSTPLERLSETMFV